MLVLLVSVALLFGAPALLLWMGRLIERRTDFRNRVAKVEPACTGEEWYFRAPASLAGEAAETPAPAADQGWPKVSGAQDDLAWFRRPMKPLFRGFPWTRSGQEHA